MAVQNENITNSVMTEKAMMTFAEAIAYTGFSRGYMYKLTMQRRIPYYKPNGKNIFFDRKELEEWLHGNRVPTSAELDAVAVAQCKEMGGRV